MQKALMKCNCGQTVAVGSVFCFYCRSEVMKRNAKITRIEEYSYQKSIRVKGKKKRG